MPVKTQTGRIEQIGSIVGGRSVGSGAAKENDITLILLSGGADSTAALVKLLDEGDNHVHAHHIYLKNPSGLERPQLQAAYRLVEYCKENYREFDFTVSTLDFSFMRTVPPDVFHTNYVAGLMSVTDSRIKRLARCVIVEDEEDNSYSSRKDTARSIFQTLVPEGRRPDYIYPIRDMTKADVVAYLPPDLLRLTWSCRTPELTKNGFKRCGKCITCEQIKDGLASRDLPQDWLQEEVDINSACIIPAALKFES